MMQVINAYGENKATISKVSKSYVSPIKSTQLYNYNYYFINNKAYNKDYFNTYN